MVTNQGPEQSPAAVTPSRALRVLLVEDDPLLAATLVRQLRNRIDVTVVVSPEEIMNLTGRFDLGIFDLDLPGASGVEIARLCEARGLVNQCVFFSGTPDGDHVEAAREFGEFIEKGAGISAILRRVFAQCERPSGVYGQLPSDRTQAP